MSAMTLNADLERIACGDGVPRDALALVRGFLDRDPERFAQRAYILLKSVILRMLSARRTSNLREWIDVIRQASALAKGHGQTSWGDRMLTLSDLAADWTRLSEAHPVHVLLDRPHVRRILEALHSSGGQAPRLAILAEVGIGDANLSRILGALETAGLITRDQRRQRTLTLTAEGRQALTGLVPTRAAGSVPVGAEPVRLASEGRGLAEAHESVVSRQRVVTKHARAREPLPLDLHPAPLWATGDVSSLAVAAATDFPRDSQGVEPELGHRLTSVGSPLVPASHKLLAPPAADLATRSRDRLLMQNIAKRVEDTE